jgi:uncharacterized protein (TIGR00369 family)
MSEEHKDVISISAMQAIVDRSSFNRWLGMTVESLTAESLVIRLRWREELISSPERQSTHGGVLATLIDSSGDYAIAARLGHAVPTIDLHVDYHRVATPGDLIAEARVIHLGSTVATAASRVTDMAGRLIASGRGVYMTGSSARPKTA